MKPGDTAKDCKQLLESAKEALAVLKQLQTDLDGDDLAAMPWPVIDRLDLAIDIMEVTP